MKKRMELDLKKYGVWGGVEGNQAMSQSRCARTFGFPVGKEKKRKKHGRVQNAIRRLCAVTAGMTVISLFSIHVHRQMKRRRKNFLNPLFPASM